MCAEPYYHVDSSGYKNGTRWSCCLPCGESLRLGVLSNSDGKVEWYTQPCSSKLSCPCKKI